MNTHTDTHTHTFHSLTHPLTHTRTHSHTHTHTHTRKHRHAYHTHTRARSLISHAHAYHVSSPPAVDMWTFPRLPAVFTTEEAVTSVHLGAAPWPSAIHRPLPFVSVTEIWNAITASVLKQDPNTKKRKIQWQKLPFSFSLLTSPATSNVFLFFFIWK